MAEKGLSNSDLDSKTKEKQKIGESTSGVKKLDNLGVVSLKLIYFNLFFFRTLCQLEMNGKF